MPALAEPSKKLFTVEEYYRMAETGILRPDDRMELIEGEIIGMSPIGNRHAFVTAMVNRLFQGWGEKAFIYVQAPLRISQYSEPEPDILVLRLPVSRYSNRHPTPDDVLLLAEVADSSLRFDRNVKFPLYARHGIQEAWLIDLEADAIEVHRSPSDDGYRDVRILRGGETLSPLAFPDCFLTVGAILGKE